MLLDSKALNKFIGGTYLAISYTLELVESHVCCGVHYNVYCLHVNQIHQRWQK